HPLPEGGAEEWIRSAMEDVTFACVERAENAFGGIVALHLEPGNRAQLGGWCGEPWRHNGYAVEAMHAAVRYGYEALGLETIYALRKGRLWIAPRDFADRRLPFRHSPNEWHLLDETGEEASRPPRPNAADLRLFSSTSPRLIMITCSFLRFFSASSTSPGETASQGPQLMSENTSRTCLPW